MASNIVPVRSHFGGPSSVGGTHLPDTASSGLDSYFDFKTAIEKEMGLAFEFDYNALFQAASDSPGEKSATGGVFRLFGRWTLTGKDTDDTGILVYKVENRHGLGTEIPPQGLGSELGYLGLTALPFSRAGWVLTNLFWEQHLMENRLAFVTGFVDVTDYVDTYSLVSPWTGFSNLAFSTSPTIPAPNQGLGAAVRLITKEDFYLNGGLADANGDPTRPDQSLESFFADAEYFTHVEIGWISNFKERFTNNIHVTAWHSDQRTAADTPAGWGLAFSFNRVIAQKWEPFLRAGFAKDGGALWDRSVSLGLGYLVRQKQDQIGLGLNWGRPCESSVGPGLDDQVTAEFFYRWQLLNALAITPDLQVLINPAQNPNEDVIAVFGIRVRIIF